MALSKRHEYIDEVGDIISIESAVKDAAIAYVEVESEFSTVGVSVTTRSSVPLALNILGYNRPGDEQVSTGRFEVGDAGAFIASSEAARDRQVRTAAALLTAVDAYDKRTARLATAEKRREAAAISLSKAVADVNSLAIASKTFGNAEIGKLREALGRYDAELAN